MKPTTTSLDREGETDAGCLIPDVGCSNLESGIWQPVSSSMSTSTVTRVIVIKNKQGLHARPAELFARTAYKFQSRIELVKIKENRRVEARNIIDLLTLGAAEGTELLIEAEGPDAEEAVEALANLVEQGFPREDVGEEEKETERL
jgi:phosphotransferase system HPr (HPr) family protein